MVERYQSDFDLENFDSFDGRLRLRDRATQGQADYFRKLIGASVSLLARRLRPGESTPRKGHTRQALSG